MIKKALLILIILSITHNFNAQEFIGTCESISPTIAKRIVGKSWKPTCPIPLENLRYLRVAHWGYDDQVHLGEMIVHKDVAADVIAIFEELFESHFPIEKMHLIDNYFKDGKADNEIDDDSVADNNTSAFFYRLINGTDIVSAHGLGIALDINPRVNPFYNPETDYICPKDAREFLDRTRMDVKGLVTKESICYKAFMKRGWKWGGNWTDVKDYQHFSPKEVLHCSVES